MVKPSCEVAGIAHLNGEAVPTGAGGIGRIGGGRKAHESAGISSRDG